MIWRGTKPQSSLEESSLRLQGQDGRMGAEGTRGLLRGILEEVQNEEVCEGLVGRANAQWYDPDEGAFLGDASATSFMYGVQVPHTKPNPETQGKGRGPFGSLGGRGPSGFLGGRAILTVSIVLMRNKDDVIHFSHFSNTLENTVIPRDCCRLRCTCR